MLELRIVQHMQTDSVLWQHILPALIIYSALLAASAPADGLTFIHNRNRFGVLAFPIFNDEIQVLVIAVNRKPTTFAVLAGVTEKEVKSAELAYGVSVEDSITKIEDIVFIAVSPHHLSPLCGRLLATRMSWIFGALRYELALTLLETGGVSATSRIWFWPGSYFATASALRVPALAIFSEETTTMRHNAPHVEISGGGSV